MTMLLSRCFNTAAIRPCFHHNQLVQQWRSSKRFLTQPSGAYLRYASTTVTNVPSSSSSFSSITADPYDSFWSNPDIKGIDRSVKTEKRGDGTFFGYKLEDSTIPLKHRSAPRSLPTRHSSHLFPGPICPPNLLVQASAEILQSDLGSLYAFDSQKTKEEEHIQTIQDKFEVLLRGYSACMEGSYLNQLLYQTSAQQHLDLEPLKAASVSAQFASKTDFPRMQQHVTTMRRLLERLEREADMYWKDKHSKLSSTTFMGLGEEDGTTSIQNEEEDAMAVQMKEEEPPVADSTSSSFAGAAPGPTTTMYDLVLDANAVYASRIPLEDDDAKILAMNAARSLFQTILDRHEADGGPANVNPSTIPSPRSFNALIQTAAMVQYSSGEIVRDEAIDLAFSTFDRMHRSDAVNRTWTTYEYLLNLVLKFIPTSRSKGNIAYALFIHACDEGVVNEAVWEKLKSFAGLGNGPDFEKYLQDNADKTWRQLPHKWRRYANTPNYGSKLRRSYNDGSFYYG